MEPAFTVTLDGVDVGFRDMTPLQLTMVRKIVNQAAKKAKKVGEGVAAMEMLEQLLNIIESLILTEEDRDHVMDAVMRGVVDAPEVFLILRKGQTDSADDDAEETPKPKKAARTAAPGRVQK